MATLSLFEHDPAFPSVRREALSEGVWLLRNFVFESVTTENIIFTELKQILAAAPLRRLITPGGHRMSVTMTNCGERGWFSDQTGYRYIVHDPRSNRRWPEMPDAFCSLAQRAAETAGFLDFQPDACLINRYAPGARLTLHQDRNERDLVSPIVSVSLGIPAVFLLGGLQREDKTMRIPLMHGDVMVWGGPARLRYHAVLPIEKNNHPLTGAYRFNLTFRQTGWT